MLFNSLDFAIFLPVTFCLYWFVAARNIKLQNALIVLASYVFYGWWDWRFLFLILLSTIIDYVVGRGLLHSENPKRRKALLLFSILANLGMLGFFKYFNFFIENFTQAFSLFGFQISGNTLNIILPVGISFYTFQTLSYSIDVYRKKLTPTTDFIAFAAFVSFFPQLVAGPIERATHLLPQFHKKRKFCATHATDGMRQILWGLFKKIVIADNCAVYANQIFNNSQDYSGSTLVLGALFFAFQIYGDFSGYSDIAIGTARLFDFRLTKNFAFPYFSRDMAEFWRRWHISLSTWIRDYLYIPLGGSRGSTLRQMFNVFVIFAISGFWHGANWTFIAWGVLNAGYFLPLLLLKRNRIHTGPVAENRMFPTRKELIGIVITFNLTLIAWIFFRAKSVSHATAYLREIFSASLFTVPDFPGIGKAMSTLLLILVFQIVEWLGRDREYAIERPLIPYHPLFRWAEAYTIVFLIILYGNYQKNPFIYFQF